MTIVGSLKGGDIVHERRVHRRAGTVAKRKRNRQNTLLEAIEAALISGYKRNFNSAPNVRVEIQRDTGEVKVFARKTVVEEPQDTRLEISLDAALDISPTYQLGDVVEIEVTPREFGRIAAQTAKQVVTQRIREAERSIVYSKFVDREEDIVTGVIQRQDARVAYVDLGQTEAVMPLSEQMPTDKFKSGDHVKALITRVERTTKGPQIVLSRTHPGLLKRLFELEVPANFTKASWRSSLSPGRLGIGRKLPFILQSGSGSDWSLRRGRPRYAGTGGCQ